MGPKVGNGRADICPADFDIANSRTILRQSMYGGKTSHNHYISESPPKAQAR